MVRFDRFLSFLTFLGGLGGPEWSKTVRGTRTIILVPLIPHIDHSRPISTQLLVPRMTQILTRRASGRLRRLGRNFFRKSDPDSFSKNESRASKFRAEPRSRNIQISAMCQKTSISVYGNLRVFLMSSPPVDAAGRILGICLGTPPRLGRDKIES